MKKEKKIPYDKNGYIDWKTLLKDRKEPFIFMTGGRGIGKSYGLLKYLIESGIRFLYLRRTEAEANIQRDRFSSQFAPILDDMGKLWSIKKNAKIGLICVDNGDGEEEEVAYIASMSTFHNLRGISMDIEFIIYDEFVPEIHARKMAQEGIALSNVYETLNRNRELNGEKPLRLIGLSNSLNIANDIFITFNLVEWAEECMNGAEIKTDGIKCLMLPHDSPISKKKKETALYLATSKEYARMALENEFFQNDFSLIKKVKNLGEYRAFIQVGELSIYRHKSRPEIYCRIGKSTAKRRYESSMAELAKFRNVERRLLDLYWDMHAYFESYNALALFVKYFEI